LRRNAALRIFHQVKISVEYTGELHCDAEHGPSRTKLATDARRTTRAKENHFHRPILWLLRSEHASAQPWA
jgi:hypothetical protein